MLLLMQRNRWRNSMSRKRKNSGPQFAVPPDGVPSEYLIDGIRRYSQKKLPLLWFSRMNRLPYGFVLYIKANYVDVKQ